MQLGVQLTSSSYERIHGFNVSSKTGSVEGRGAILVTAVWINSFAEQGCKQAAVGCDDSLVQVAHPSARAPCKVHRSELISSTKRAAYCELASESYTLTISGLQPQ